jgi:hypothetical protein
VSLFPFLAVLICTMGALVLLLLAVTRQARLQAIYAAQAEKTQRQEDAKTQRTMAHWRAEELRKSRRQTESQLTDARLVLGHVEDHIRRLRQQLPQLTAASRSAEQAGAEAVRRRGAQQGEVQQVEAQVADAEKRLAEAQQAARSRPRSYAIIPYEGPNQTHRRPIYLECRADELVLRPENIVFTEDDFDGPQGPGNPLAAALRAAREHMLAQGRFDAQHGGEPYPLLLVRPSGIGFYYAARSAMRSWASEFGYELIGEDWPLQFPPADPTLAQVVQRTVQSARIEQQQLIAAAPSRWGKRVSAVAAYDSSSGTSDRDDGGEASETGVYASRPSPRYGNPYLSATVGTTPGGGTPGTGGPGGMGGGTGNGTGGPGNGTGGSGGLPGGGFAGGAPGGGPSGGGVPGGGLSGGSAPGGGLGGGAPGVGLSGGGAPGVGLSGGGAPGGGLADGVPGGGLVGGAPGGGLSGGVPGGGPAVGGLAASGFAGGSPGSATTGAPGGVPNSGTGVSSDGNQSNQSGGARSTVLPDGYVFGRPAGDPPPSRGPADPSAAGKPATPLRPGEWYPTPEPPPKKPDEDDKKPGKKPKPIDRRIENWGLRNAGENGLAITRPIHVNLYPDRLVLVPETGVGQERTIPIPAGTAKSIDPLVTAVWEQMDTWGMAGKNMYWRPLLSIYIAPGAERRFQDLDRLLQGSGLIVQKKP